MIPKEFKETEVRVYKKNRKLSDEKIEKYVTKLRTFNVITYFSWVSISKGLSRSGVIILSVHLKSQQVKIIMENQKSAGTSSNPDVNTYTYINCKTYYSYERTANSAI